MEKMKLFEEFVNEAHQPINDQFGDNTTAAKIAKDLMKKHETLVVNAENFDKIQAAVKELADEPWNFFYNVANATKYAEWIPEQMGGHKFLFDKSGKLKFIIAYVGPGRKIVEFPYIADKNKDEEVENWAFANYPRFFKNLDWIVFGLKPNSFEYSTEGTFELISAPTKKIAMENTKANPSNNDSFWQNHGIAQVSKQDIKEKQKEIKQKADHYAELVKTFK